MLWILTLTIGEITGIITGVTTGIVAIIAAIGKIINEKRRDNGNLKCCITGRELKPKKKRESNRARKLKNKKASGINS